MTLSPTVPRFSARAASCASDSIASVTPNEALAAWVPATDWNTRSTGAPRPISSMAVVTCVNTQPWVGISNRAIRPSSRRNSSPIAARLSDAGLMPITASPLP